MKVFRSCQIELLPIVVRDDVPIMSVEDQSDRDTTGRILDATAGGNGTRRQGRIGHRGRAAIAGAAAARVVDGDRDGIAPLLGVLMTAADRVAAADARNRAGVEAAGLAVP